MLLPGDRGRGDPRFGTRIIVRTNASLQASTQCLPLACGTVSNNLTGIRLDSVPLILEGAVPAAVLALLVQALFELAERAVVPKGLRLTPQGD